jgi:hypothetical protein
MKETMMLEDAKPATEASETDDDRSGLSRRGALKCMVWAGTGILWTLSGGVPKSLGLLGDALAAVPAGFSFLQISDSHIGFNKPANPDALGTLREAIGKVKAVKSRPAFMIHTGDITHLSKPDEFDNADQIISEAKLNVHYVPGEHDFIDEGLGKAYLDRYGKGTKGQGWYSFDDHGVHFIGLVNVVDLKAGGLGRLAPISSPGSPTISRTSPRALRSSSSPTSRSGPSMPTGAGAPMTDYRRSIS